LIVCIQINQMSNTPADKKISGGAPKSPRTPALNSPRNTSAGKAATAANTKSPVHTPRQHHSPGSTNSNNASPSQSRIEYDDGEYSNAGERLYKTGISFNENRNKKLQNVAKTQQEREAKNLTFKPAITSMAGHITRNKDYYTASQEWVSG